MELHRTAAQSGGSQVKAARFPRQPRPPPPTGWALPAAAASVCHCPLTQKSLMSGAPRPISGARGRPPPQPWAPRPLLAKGGSRPTGAAAHGRGSQRGVKCSSDAPTGPICILPVSLLFPLLFLPHPFHLDSPPSAL